MLKTKKTVCYMATKVKYKFANYLQSRSLAWWLWGSLVVDMVVSVEDFLFIEGYHGFIYEFYNIPPGITKEDLLYSVFLKSHLIHLVFILVAIRFQANRLGKGIMQFIVAAFFTFTGLLFPISLVMSGGRYVAGAFSGTFLVLPFFTFFAFVLIKRKVMSVRTLVVWIAIAPILTYFILGGLN